MLSQALPDETVVPATTHIYMPQRVKSVYVRLVEDAKRSMNTKSKEYQYQENNDLEDNSFVNSSTLVRIPSGTYRRVPTAHDIVSARNLNTRIAELEKTNVNLRRMLELVKNDPSRNIDRISGTAPRLLIHRAAVSNSLGLPTQREGRMGGSWRHIKQTNSYSNGNLLFIDGTVRINDSRKYPENVYGYPPKVHQNDEDLIGINQKLSGSSLDFEDDVEKVRNRKLSIKHFDNPFHERAKSGYVYWPKESKFPENNKKKAKTYTTGAYKTFYGLSDSLLKL